MGFLLNIVATIIKLILQPFLYVVNGIFAFTKGEFDQWNLDLAIAKDQYGNTLGKYLWNLLLIKKTAKHRFGNNDETISSVIGKNKVDKNLTIIGKFVDMVLEAIDDNHSIDAIDNTEQG